MRWAMAVSLVILVAILCIYAGFYHPGLTLEECLSRPAACDGAVIYTPHESTIGDIAEGWFSLRWIDKEIQVKGSVPSSARESYVQVKGIFHREGYIEALAVHVGRYRRLKMAVSIVGAAVVFFMLWKNFKWDADERAFTAVKSGRLKSSRLFPLRSK